MAIVQAGQRDKLGGFKKRKDEKKGRQGASVWSLVAEKQERAIEKERRRSDRRAVRLCKGETAGGLGANGSGMGLAWGLGIGN